MTTLDDAITALNAAVTTLNTTANTGYAQAVASAITQANTATTQAGIATTKAGEASSSAIAAAASAASINPNNIDINGGTVDGTVIGGAVPAAGSFTTVSASGGPVAVDVFGAGNKYLDFKWYGSTIGSIYQDTGTYLVIDSITKLPLRVNGTTVAELTPTGLSVTGGISATGANAVNTAHFTGAGTGAGAGYIFLTNAGTGFAKFGVEGATASIIAGATNYSTSLSGANGINFSGDNGATKHATLDASGNLGLGVVPSGWTNTYKAFALGSANSTLSGFWDGASAITTLANGGAVIGGAWTYTLSGQAVTRYAQNISGQHQWHTAPSGTAGQPISFTQALTLSAAGNLLLGGTSDPGGAKVLYIANGTVPGTPSGGGVIYVDAGALKYKGSSGTVTTLGAA